MIQDNASNSPVPMMLKKHSSGNVLDTESSGQPGSLVFTKEFTAELNDVKPATAALTFAFA